MTGEPSTPLHVIYIAGATRSGSTILDRILASRGDAVAVGELGDIWECWDKTSHSGVCGCTDRLRECTFWRQVHERAFGPSDANAFSRRNKLSRQVVKAFFPRLWRSFDGLEGAAEYRNDLSRPYRAVAQVAGVHTVIDATKYAAHALALSQAPGIRLSVLHLVRDSRGVAFSWPACSRARCRSL